MDFKLSSFKSNKSAGTVEVPKKLMEQIYNLLSNVECVCVWSETDNQYLNVHDVPKDLVDEIETIVKLQVS